jgi:lysophospholipase L1-like esterase
MQLSDRKSDFVVAAILVLAALAASPVGIRFATGRLDLTPRVVVLSLTFAGFLLIMATAAVSGQAIRRFLIRVLVCLLPLGLLAAIEAGAVIIRLSDRIAPLEDFSILTNQNWPPYLMSQARRVYVDGVSLYQPFQGDGIVINALGLRTAPPSPKKPGEWRIAVTGGSVAFGWRVLDADTIPARLQEALHERGHQSVTVYNFGVDAILFADELAITKRFRDVYEIDQVIFFTGANDASRSYLAASLPDDSGLTSGINAFELIKVVGRLKAMLAQPSPALLAMLDNDLLPKLAQKNSLRDGLMAASSYCQTAAMPCDVVLQPLLLLRKEPRGPEVPIARTLNALYPRYDQVFATMYRSAFNAGLPVHDSRSVFDQSTEPYFFDVAHLNERGMKLVAAWIASIAATSVPKSASRAGRSP